MKPQKLLLGLLFLGATLSAVRVLARPEPAAEPSAEQAAELRAKLERAASEVRTRLHMPALIEIDPDDESIDREISELHRSGWIVEASLDEVEAALKAAAGTASREDDIAANQLAHRASCRFFFKDSAELEPAASGK